MVIANTAPEFEAETAERSVEENTAAGMYIGAAVAATDAENDTLTYTLGGDDMASFDIDSATGQLMTMAALDFETRQTYMVTLKAEDSFGASDSIMVTITVTNMDEAPAFEAETAGLKRGGKHGGGYVHRRAGRGHGRRQRYADLHAGRN